HFLLHPAEQAPKKSQASLRLRRLYVPGLAHLAPLSLSTRDGLRLAVGDQRVDVLDRKSPVGLIESDRSAACSRREVNELLQVFSARRRRRVLGEPEDEIEDLSDVLGEVGDVFVKRAVIDREEADLIVLERHEL